VRGGGIIRVEAGHRVPCGSMCLACMSKLLSYLEVNAWSAGHDATNRISFLLVSFTNSIIFTFKFES
jgi:hypothetical protein